MVTRTVPHAGATHASARPAAAHAPVRPAAASVAHGTDLTSAGLLQIKVKAHFAKTDIRSVFGELERLSKVNIVVDKAVPSYRLDVVLDHKSMLYALDRITKATGLVYKLDGHRVLIQTKSIAMH